MRNILNIKWAVDTNILVYLFDKGSPFHSQTKEFFTFVEKYGVEIIIAQQSLVELVQVLTKWYKLPLKRAVEQILSLIDREFTLIQPLPQTYSDYLGLCTLGFRPKNHFDLYLAATLMDNQVYTIVTNNPKDFSAIEKLKACDLKEIEKEIKKIKKLKNKL